MKCSYCGLGANAILTSEETREVHEGTCKGHGKPFVSDEEKWEQLWIDEAFKAGKLAKAVHEYQLEMMNPATDYTMRMLRRKQMFEALAEFSKESGK